MTPSGPTPGDDGGGDGELTREFLQQIGARIRVLRSRKSLTVQQLADLSDVSRRLLTQIEHGQANPSLVAVTRIARSLGTDFTELVGDSVPGDIAVERIPASAHVLVWTSQLGSTAHLLVSTPGVRVADMWLWSLISGDQYGGRPDSPGSIELFHVLTGELTVRADSMEVVIAAGESGRLRSDRVYQYVNNGPNPVTFLRTVALAR
ncbi:helix-turn-helix domain-containing protein [Rhodococcus sp. IEGM 1381]|uniref:helix-turn-helix domain-containing protein n=1 Tax=Rhodococcus sp. IEGM 1381 TaxID=3047085 RepID=UPI0024B75630|nr:helix-turn-helix domain-containing protein [Rhodococcus sp. IEGM 1381]MDI9894526.1 helix-turn-helix domain-containing protein [Rhodococcus sp. IEGM 1381]